MSKILYTGGTFDLFHFGHANFLKQCASLAEKVIVSLNTDEFIEEYKKDRPILNYEERERSLRCCRYVTDVVPNIGGADSKPAILTVKPNIIAIGDDWAQRDYYAQMQFTQNWLDEHGFTLVYVPYTRGISSSEIKSRILNRGKNG